MRFLLRRVAETQMPGISGLGLQARLKAEQFNIPIIFITGNGGARMRIQAMREARSSSWGNRWIINYCSKPSEQHLICERHGYNNRIVR